MRFIEGIKWKNFDVGGRILGSGWKEKNRKTSSTRRERGLEGRLFTWECRTIRERGGGNFGRGRLG